MKYKKILSVIVISLVLVSFILIVIKFPKNNYFNVSSEQVMNDNTSITYFIDIDTIKRAEIRISDANINNSLLAIYIPFRISIDNIHYNEESLILGVKEYGTYSIITVFVTDDSQNIYLELINNNKEMYDGISLNGNIEKGSKNVELRIKETELSNSSISNNLIYIKNHYVNFSTEVEIADLSSADKVYLKLPSNKNYKLYSSSGTYILNYSIDGYVDKDEGESYLHIIISAILWNILLPVLIHISNVIISNEKIEKISKGEFLIGIIVFLFSIICLIIGYIKKINSVYLTLTAILGIIILLGYIYTRRIVIKKLIEKLKSFI